MSQMIAGLGDFFSLFVTLKITPDFFTALFNAFKPVQFYFTVKNFL
jgi:hypothetical protein